MGQNIILSFGYIQLMYAQPSQYSIDNYWLKENKARLVLVTSVFFHLEGNMLANVQLTFYQAIAGNTFKLFNKRFIKH